MNSKRITAAVFAFAAAFSCIGAFNGTGVAMANAAEDFSWEIKEPETLTEGDFTYVQSGRFWNVQKYSGSDKNVVIPERVNGVTVQGIEAKASIGGEGTPVKAALPGNVLKVLVSEGDSISEGDVIAVVEAMKMETEIKSPVSGTVKSVEIEVGNKVQNGQVLVTIG